MDIARVDDSCFETLDDWRRSRREVFSQLLELPDSWMDRVSSFQGQPISMHWVALRYADHDEEHAIQIADTLQHMPGWQQSRVQRLLAVNEVVMGELLAPLEGLTDDDLDVEPVDPPGEWSLRQTLSHIIFVEQAYRIDIQQAVEHFDRGEPVTDLLDLDIPHLYPEDTLADLISRLDQARDQTIQELHGLDERYLAAQTRWDNLDVDVNFLIMRLGHHIREHTAHIRKWRVQTGKHQQEMARLLGRSWVTHGMIRGSLVGSTNDLWVERPIPEEWNLQEIIEHLRNADFYFNSRIHDAVDWATWTENASA